MYARVRAAEPHGASGDRPRSAPSLAAAPVRLSAASPKLTETRPALRPGARKSSSCFAIPGLAWPVLGRGTLDSELGRLLLQIIGVIVMTVAIGLLLPFLNDADDTPPSEDERRDRALR